MQTNHSTSIAIPYGINTQGFFSFQDPEALIVFVHGFGGSSIGTWNNFPSYCVMDQEFKKADIIYYGYDTFNGQAGDHAGEFYAFLKLAVQPLANKILPASQKLAERNYSRIVLVAHSLGAIIVRQALLFAHTDNQPWLSKSRMALFAPAHSGAKIISLAMETLPGLASLLGIVAKFRYPILNDLDSEEAGIIGEIRAKSEKLQNEGKGDFTKAKLVVFAKGDKVVRNIPYLDDAPPLVKPGHSHTSVCKPQDNFMDPITLVKSIL